jgi:hypothetical protein
VSNERDAPVLRVRLPGGTTAATYPALPSSTDVDELLGTMDARGRIELCADYGGGWCHREAHSLSLEVEP